MTTDRVRRSPSRPAETNGVSGRNGRSNQPAASDARPVSVNNLTMAYGPVVIQRDLTFDVQRGDIFFIMGGSGCGKSTLLRHLVGLKEPAEGKVLYSGESLWDAELEDRERILRDTGVLYQKGALWSSMTLAENVALPLQEHTRLSADQIRDLVQLKLALVGLAGFEDYFPSEISGGMQKRAGLARAMALDPAILFFDEPSAGLDPISSKLLDDLILELRDSLRATVIIVSHELSSILSIGNNSVFLDAETKTMIATGNPKELLADDSNPTVQRFLTRDAAGSAHRAAPATG